VDTATANVGSTIFGSQVQEIALNTRSFTQLMTLQPGVSSQQAQQPGFGSNTSVPFSFNGGQTSANNWTLDGGRNIDTFNGNNLSMVNLDAIAEVRIERNAYSAEYGRNGGAQVNVVTTEFYEAWGTEIVTRQDRDEIRDKHARRAVQIGSSLFQLPPGETDDYLRVYASRAPIGDWARPALAREGLANAFVYSGSIFRHMAYGYLNWLPVTMLTRHALETIGPFTTHTRSAADYHFLGRLARAFLINMIGVPTATKHDRAPAGAALTQAHLASGIGSYRFETNKLAFFDDLFTSSSDESSEEVQLLRRFHSYGAARAALRDGMRSEAIRHLREAAAPRRRLWRAYPTLAYAMIAPSTKTLQLGLRVAAAVETRGRRALEKLSSRRA